jgi:multidrug efflux pump subunit AcrA (membrane-fusion protein)
LSRRLSIKRGGATSLLLVAGTTAALLAPGSQGTAHTFTVHQVDLRSTATVSGILSAAVTYRLYFGAGLAATDPADLERSNACDTATGSPPGGPALGPVTALAVAQGSTVTKGQLLAQADDTASRAALAAAQQDLAEAQSLLGRDRPAGAVGAVAPSTTTAPVPTVPAAGTATAARVATAATATTPAAPAAGSAASGADSDAVASAQQQTLLGADLDRVQRDQDRVAELQRTVDSARITAPANGVVQRVDAVPGTTPDCHAVALVLRSPDLRVHVEVDRELLDRLRVGQSATVALPGGGPDPATSVTVLPVTADTTLLDRVTSGAAPAQTQDPAPAPASAPQTYPLDLALPSPPPTALPGMAVTVTVTLSQHLGVLAVPSVAVRHDPDGAHVSTRSCAGRSPGAVCRTVSTWVRLGASADQLTEVTAGLQPGDTVLLPH